MTLKAIMFTGACALGLVAAAPQGAEAQGAPPVTVRVIDPPVDTPPPPGSSYIRFDNHEIEVSGPVQFVPDKAGKTVMLPDGAPPPPADLFDPVTLPDGRVAYTAKTTDRVTVFAMTKVVSSPIPAPFREMIEPVGDVPQTHLGALLKGEVLLSIPYRYKRPLRMTGDLSISGLFGTQVLATKGELGFDAGEFSDGQIPHRLLCFFNPAHGNGYAVPDCFVKFPSPDGTFGLAGVSVSNNLPTQFQMSRFQATGVKAPPIETENVTIDHDFHLDLLVGWWRDGALEVTWRTEGVRLQTEKIPVTADGTVRLRIKGGWLVLRGDPAEHVKTLAEFLPDEPGATPQP